MRYYKTLLFLVLIMLSLNCINAQEDNIGLPEIRNYGRTDYKGDTQNWEIDQDKNGNVYFANNKGLFQFDGSTWRKYSMPNSELVRSFKIDESGKIYVGGNSEFGYFKPNPNGKMKYYSLSRLINKNSLELIDIVWKTHIYNNEVIFQSHSNAYIFKNNKLKIIKAPGRFKFSFQVNNKLYFQDNKLGVLQYEQGKLVKLAGTSLLDNTEIWGVLPLNDKTLLISTLNEGLFLYNYKTVTPWNTEANAFLKKYGSLGGTSFKKESIVLNSATNGVIICNKNGKIIQHFNQKKGLQNNTILASFIDIKNNIWLGFDNGIGFINKNSPLTFLGLGYGISTVYASVLHKETLYIATNLGLYYKTSNQNFNDDAYTLVSGTSGQAWNIQIIDNQLICGSNKGALIINDGKIERVIDSRGYVGFKKIPNHPNFMIGSNYFGFSIFEKKSNNWQFKNQLEGFYGYPYSFEIDDKFIWLKKDNLIYQLALNTIMDKFKSIKTYKSLSKNDKGIGSIERLNNIIYFQTNNHFYKYNSQSDVFIEDKIFSKLFNKVPKIKVINQDVYGNFWYVFNESLGVLMKNKNGQFENVLAPFSNLTGKLVTNYLSITNLDPKNIFIGSTEGLAHYDSQKASNYNIKPRAFVRSFTYPGNTIILGNGQKEANTDYEIPYKDNNVKFSFSSPTYENLENVEFSYKLEGFDSKWSNWSNSAIKEYTNLREGNYEMKIKARNSYGVHSNETSFLFSVLPPWYRHSLAYVIYLALIVLMVYFVRQRIKLKIRKNKYLQTIEQRRLYLEKETKIRQEQFELEKEIEKLKNEKLKIKILAKDKELVNNSLQVVKKNKILNGIINNLKDVNNEVSDEVTKVKLNKLNRSITKEMNADSSWKDLEKHIKNVHYDFLKRLKQKHPSISSRELDLSIYLMMNMSTKEIAEVMNISNKGVETARYRLRKKLGLNDKENLIGYIMNV